MPAGAVVTGNLFVQQALPPQGKTFVASLLLLTASPAIMVAANTISFFEYILPQRSTQAATTSWEFLNTVA
jgi:hypothetical protein